MTCKWSFTEDIIKEFYKNNRDRFVKTLPPVPMYVNPKNIRAINNSYKYPEILSDYKMQRLKKSVDSNGWINKDIIGFYLLMLPNGDLLVGGEGNHRAVLSNELSIPSVKAMVSKVIYSDEGN